MTRINLLPWREALRKERQRQFVSVTAGAALLMGVIIFYIHVHISGLISDQNARNEYLQSEIAVVDEKIKEIRDLEAKKKQLLNRMRVIQDLQVRRPAVVHMVDELVRSLPEGLYLVKVVQKSNELVIDGMAQSNARVSAFMRNLDESEWFKNPKLDVIKVEENKELGRVSRFTLKVNQFNPAEPEKEKNEEKAGKGKRKGRGR